MVLALDPLTRPLEFRGGVVHLVEFFLMHTAFNTVSGPGLNPAPPVVPDLSFTMETPTIGTYSIKTLADLPRPNPPQLPEDDVFARNLLVYSRDWTRDVNTSRNPSTQPEGYWSVSISIYTDFTVTGGAAALLDQPQFPSAAAALAWGRARMVEISENRGPRVTLVARYNAPLSGTATYEINEVYAQSGYLHLLDPIQPNATNYQRQYAEINFSARGYDGIDVAGSWTLIVTATNQTSATGGYSVLIFDPSTETGVTTNTINQDFLARIDRRTGIVELLEGT